MVSPLPLDRALDWDYFDRYLALGNQLGVYEGPPFDPFRIPAPALERCLQEDGVRAVRHVAFLLMDGRALRPEPALFVLAKAIASGHLATRQEALALLPAAARTSAHLFQLVDYLTVLTAMDRPLRAALAQWYAQRSAFDLVTAVLHGPPGARRMHEDLLALTGAQPPTPAHVVVYRWIATGQAPTERLSDPGLELLSAYHQVQETASEAAILTLLDRWPSLREGLPAHWLRQPAVWSQLLPCLSTDALVSWLPKVAGAGGLGDGEPVTDMVVRRLRLGALGRSRQAPWAALAAVGALHHAGAPASDALQSALLDLFHHRLQATRATGGTVVVALDPGASATPTLCSGMPGLSPRTAIAAMALLAAVSARNVHLLAFGRSLEVIDLDPGERLETLLRKLEAVPPGPTDGAGPLDWAHAHGVDADAFLVLNGTPPHRAALAPERALAQHRERTGRRARWLGVSWGPHRLCAAPPIDLDMVEARGFDATVPDLFLDLLAPPGRAGPT